MATIEPCEKTDSSSLETVSNVQRVQVQRGFQRPGNQLELDCRTLQEDSLTPCIKLGSRVTSWRWIYTTAVGLSKILEQEFFEHLAFPQPYQLGLFSLSQVLLAMQFERISQQRAEISTILRNLVHEPHIRRTANPLVVLLHGPCPQTCRIYYRWWVSGALRLRLLTW